MSEPMSELDDLLAELEDDTLELDQLPQQVEKKEIKESVINDDTSKDVLYKGLSGIMNKLERVADQLVNKIEAGDTYESTLQGFAAAAGHVVNVVGKIDAREARKEKMAHDKEMADIKLEHKLIEMEKKGEGKSLTGTTNIQNNNHFYGGITDCLKAIDKIEQAEAETLAEADPEIVDID